MAGVVALIREGGKWEAARGNGGNQGEPMGRRWAFGEEAGIVACPFGPVVACPFRLTEAA